MATKDKEEGTVKIKLVGANRFVDFRVSDTDAVVRNEVIDVAADIADDLLDLTYMDQRNNERPLFEVYDPEAEAKALQAKEARAARRSRKKA